VIVPAPSRRHVEQQERLDEVLVDRRAGGLDHVDVVARGRSARPV
jgi:hypothetical protein